MGKLPGYEDEFVLGCVSGSYTIGPYLDELMGDFVLERTAKLPLFDPGRDFPEAVT
jgi:hypothetical protein